MSKSGREKYVAKYEQQNTPEELPLGDKMTSELLTFADVFYRASGRNKTFMNAALQARTKLDKVAALELGALWATYPCVQAYWDMMDRTQGAVRRSLHIQALLRQGEIADDPDTETRDRIAANASVIQGTVSAFESGDRKDKGSSTGASMNESAESTFLAMKASMEKVFGTGGDDDESSE